jgi:quinol monooxygenase YgiN
LLSPTRAEAGCVNYDLHQSQTDPALFVFYENWTSEAHLDAHSKSPHIQSFRKVAGEILEGPVEITKWQLVI